MRFSRSLSSPFTPLEIRRAGRAAHRDSAKLQILMEQWASANGVWSQSEFYLQVKQKRKHRSYGSRRWLTRGELLQKYGDSAVVDAIIAAKMADPEASKSQETRQYLVWDKEGEEDTMDDVTTQLFEAADAAEDEEPTKKTKKASGKSGKKQKASHKKKKKQAKKGGKKKKAKKSSSSSTQSSSSSSASNDSSDEPDSSESEDDAKTKKPATKRKGSGTGDENQDRADAGKKLTEEQKRKKAEKEADKKRKEEERKREQEKRKAEKEKEDKLKKEQRSANQVITKLGSNIQRGTSLDDKLSKMSGPCALPGTREPSVPHTLHQHYDDVATSVAATMKRVRNQVAEPLVQRVKKKNGQNLFTAKAFNGRCILSWLADRLMTAVESHPQHQILNLTSSAMTLGWSALAKFMYLMECNGRYLTHGSGLGVGMLAGTQLRQSAWLMKPKHHDENIETLCFSQEVSLHRAALRPWPKGAFRREFKSLDEEVM
ncbi:unnamed protein product [Durusdinium trenchii]|uniref:Uncharacterized protein n=1 Tax=Durusdinium trenchii TaxID=1381693 RepID=A0ABP0IH46_9DINO